MPEGSTGGMGRAEGGRGDGAEGVVWVAGGEEVGDDDGVWFLLGPLRP